MAAPVILCEIFLTIIGSGTNRILSANFWNSLNIEIKYVNSEKIAYLTVNILIGGENMMELILRRQNPDGTTEEKVLYSFSDATSYAFEREVLHFPDLDIHLREQSVTCCGNNIPLSFYEFFTLCYLAEHPGWIHSKEQIYEDVWKQPGELCGNAVPNVISQLRHKLWPCDPKGGYIRTVQNSGYKFEVGEELFPK